MKSLLLASASLLLFSAAPVVAADGVAYEAPVLFDWTGGYIGVQAGYSWGDSDLKDFTGAGAIVTQSTPDADGWLGGVYVGYNRQFANNVVLGVDADIAWLSADSGFEGALDDVGAPYRLTNIPWM